MFQAMNEFTKKKEQLRIQSRCINCGAPLADRNDKCSFCSPDDLKEIKVVDVSEMSKKEVESVVNSYSKEEEPKKNSNIILRFIIFLYIIHPFILYYSLRGILGLDDLVPIVLASFFFGWFLYTVLFLLLYDFIRFLLTMITGR